MKLREILLNAAQAMLPPLVGGMPDVARAYQNYAFPESNQGLELPLAAARVSTVAAILTRIAYDCAKVSPTFFKVGRDGTETKIERVYNNITDVWERANPQQSGTELAVDLQTSWDTTGNGYLFMERFGLKGPPQEIYSVPGHMVTPIVGPRRTVPAYEYRNADGLQLMRGEDVIHFRYWNANVNPSEPWPLGMSPMAAARSGYQTRYVMGQWQQKLFERGGQANLVMSVKDGNAITDPQVAQMQEAMDARFAGLKNAFKPVFLRGVEVVRAGMTLDEMNFIEQAKLSDAELCHVYLMHPILMGFAESTGTGLQFKDALLDHWMTCIGSRLQLRDAVMTERFCPLFAKGAERIICRTDISGVLPVQSARLELAKSLVIWTGQPGGTPNEARELFGAPPSDDPEADDIHWRTQGALNVGAEGPVPPGDEKAKPKADTQDETKEPKPEGRKDTQPAAAARVVASEDMDVLGARRKRADANLRRAEKKTEAFARGFLARQAASADRQLRDLAAQEGVELARTRLVADPQRVGFSPDPEEIERAQALFEALIIERGTEVAADSGVEVTLQVARERIAEFARSKATFALANVSQTTQDAVRRTMADALAAGASWSDVVAAVRQYFDDAQQYRPAMIARTETTGAYNYGAMEGFAAAGVEYKRWITVGDDAVRETHLMAEGDGPVPIDARFSNGLLYPGEPGSDAGEVVNCRCVVEAETADAKTYSRGWNALFPSVKAAA